MRYEPIDPQLFISNRALLQQRLMPNSLVAVNANDIPLTNADGSLTYDFLSSLIAIQPYYVIRFLGGLLVLSGMVVMAWNLWHTAADARAGHIKPILIPAPEMIPEPVHDQTPEPLPAKA